MRKNLKGIEKVDEEGPPARLSSVARRKERQHVRRSAADNRARAMANGRHLLVYTRNRLGTSSHIMPELYSAHFSIHQLPLQLLQY